MLKLFRLMKVILRKKKRIKGADSMLDFIRKNPKQRIIIDSPKGYKKGFGNETKLPLPFDYGEYPDYINPADNMGWDIIICPSCTLNDLLLPVGVARYKTGIPKEGNDKIILSKDGKVSAKDKKIINDFFKELNSIRNRFQPIEWT